MASSAIEEKTGIKRMREDEKEKDEEDDEEEEKRWTDEKMFKAPNPPAEKRVWKNEELTGVAQRVHVGDFLPCKTNEGKFQYEVATFDHDHYRCGDPDLAWRKWTDKELAESVVHVRVGDFVPYDTNHHWKATEDYDHIPGGPNKVFVAGVIAHAAAEQELIPNKSYEQPDEVVNENAYYSDGDAMGDLSETMPAWNVRTWKIEELADGVCNVKAGDRVPYGTHGVYEYVVASEDYEHLPHGPNPLFAAIATAHVAAAQGLIPNPSYGQPDEVVNENDAAEEILENIPAADQSLYLHMAEIYQLNGDPYGEGEITDDSIEPGTPGTETYFTDDDMEF